MVLGGVVVPPASVYAQSSQEISDQHTNRLDASDNKPMKQDYAGPLTARKDDKNSKAIKALGDLRSVPGEALPAAGEQSPAIKTGELVDKRTAFSTQTRNADGTITETLSQIPVNYQKDGKWQKIDTTLIEDKDPGDANNFVADVYNEVQSWFTSETHFKVKDNDWQARFSPSDFSKGMVRVGKGGDQVGFVPQNAKQVAPVITTNDHGQQIVHYYDLWPGVNAEYIVTGGQIKEAIILKDKDAASQVYFKVVGANLESRSDGGFIIKGAFNDQFSITPVNLLRNDQGPVLDATLFGQKYKQDTLTVSVDQSYLQNLPTSAFPVVIDPGVDTTNGYSGDWYRSIRNDNFVCYNTSNPSCKIYVGGFNNGGYWDEWRSAYYAPYGRFQDPNYKLKNAKIHLNMQGGAGWHGTTGGRWIDVYRSTCNNGWNCVDGNLWGGAGHTTLSSEIDVTGLYQNRIAAGDFGMWMMLVGEEEIGYETFKEFDPAFTTMDFTWSDPPPAPTMDTPGVQNQVFADPQVSFKLNPIANPNDSNVPLQYEFRISSTASGQGTVIQTGLLSASQWTVPDGMLQDGSTYYVAARSYDPTSPFYSSWGAATAFKIDMRTGKDKTQTYDTLGSVDVNLATGNVATSAASHTSAALGGSLGVSLDYNSPVAASPGLTAEYWDNPNRSGAPKLTRVDRVVDFDWASGAPTSGFATDNFSARWSGYFIVQDSGQYQFGANNDDQLTININAQQAYTNSGCWPTACYGSAITLTAGQVVPIEITYTENTGNAVAKLFVKGPNSFEGIPPPEWLRTAVRPVAQPKGLIGSYYYDDGSHNFGSTNALFMQRIDPFINFNWGTGVPVDGSSTDDFLVRWSGYVTAPTSGSYEFGANSDDGVRIKLGAGGGETTVLNAWADQAAADRWGSGYTLSAGVPTPITVEYYEKGNLASMSLKVRGAGLSEQVAPTAWLSPKAEVLPPGWNLGLDADGNLSYDRIKINQNSAVLTDSSGGTHEYTFANGGYKPPVNEDGQLTRNADGTFTLLDIDGRTYMFNADGTLQSATSAVDDRKPAALKYEYTGTPAKIQYIRDGVDPANRWARVYYSGESECGSSPSGFDTAAPAGMLCAVKTNDGRATYFYYKLGLLARIAEPGDEYTDYQYDSYGKITGIRDSLANDAVAAGVRADDATVLTELYYDVLGRATSVKQPAPTTGSSRLEHSIEYLPGATKQHITGATEPNGFTRKLEYDSLYRTTKVTDIANLNTTQEWDANKDLLFSSTDPTSLKSTAIYDDEDRPIENYGPAPSGWFGSDRKPTTGYVSQVPRTDIKYDENLWGPAVAWYNLKGNSLFGAPKLHTTGLTVAGQPHVFEANMAAPPVTQDSGMDGLGFSATGRLRVTQTGTFSFAAYHNDKARLLIDDAVVFDNWNGGSSSAGSRALEVGKSYRFRFDYADSGTPGSVSLHMTGPGKTNPNSHFDGYLSPDYSLTTSTKTYDSTIGDTLATTNYGTNPELGLAQSTTVDPAGLNLTTSMTYEPQGGSGSYLRQTTKTLPGGNATNYAYYTATETRDDPCTTPTEAYKQAGFIKLKTEPDPDGTGSQTGRGTETVYDDAGRVVASRYNTDAWACTTYDSRGRVLKTVIPAYGSEPGRTVENLYAVWSDPLVTTTWDGNGWLVVWSDLLGRTTKYRDVYDDETTSTYDTLGRLTQRQGPLGTEAFTYDTYNRLVDQKLDGTTYATLHYDQYSRIDYITYPAAGQQKLTITRDTLGRTASYTHTLGNGSSQVSDTVTRSQSGQIVSGTENGVSKAYTYDKAGRLTNATLGSHSYSYGFGTQNAAFCGTGNNKNANSGKSSNRTSQTIDGTSTTFCYDYADALVASSNEELDDVWYDTHGNMTHLGWTDTPLWLGYDSSDRNWGFEQYDGDGNGQALYYDRDLQGRITARYPFDVVEWDWQYTGGYYNHYTGTGDTPDYVRDDTWDIIEKYLQLPGGVLLTIRPAQTGNAQKTYSLPNIHGDVFATTNAAGTQLTTTLTGPFGESIQSQQVPNNTVAGSTFSYVGQHQKATETSFALQPMQMGARVYLPSLGRFTSVDPVEGGVQNNYVYPPDAVNEYDLDGRCAVLCYFMVVAAVNFIAPRLPQITAAANTFAARGQAAIAGVAGAMRSGGTRVAQIIKNGNNLIRINKSRISIGPAPTKYGNGRPGSKIPFHIHLDMGGAGIDIYIKGKPYSFYKRWR